MTGPTRITIELEPPTGDRSRWSARTWVSQPEPDPADAAPGARPVAGQTVPPQLLDAPLQRSDTREPGVVPSGYEPPRDCTCLDGYCDADHANA